MVHLLFAYDELRAPLVQRAVFARVLAGTVDCVVGYDLRDLTIDDQAVIERSGSSHHRAVVVGQPGSRIEGAVFDITDHDLRQADSYRADDYSRVLVPLESGVQAWTYAFNPTWAAVADSATDTAPPRPLDDHEHRRRAENELISSAAHVRSRGWVGNSLGRSRHFISAVALLVGDTDLLAELGVTEESVLTAWAVTLWGTRRGRSDQEDSLILTRAWFERCAERVHHRGGT